MSQIKIKSFDIERADCFLITVTDGKGLFFNLLVDCGRMGMADRIKKALSGQKLNGIVVTHVDDDHIEGVVDLVEHYNANTFLKDAFIIYNKYDESLVSYEKGRILLLEIQKQLSQKLLIKSYARNYNRENKVLERRRKKNQLPVYMLSKVQRELINERMMKKDTVYITLLSPDINTLKKFMRNWKALKKNAPLTNQSSISFLLEYGGKRLLMTGDAVMKDVLEALRGIHNIDKIDFVKISHHGAENSNQGIEELVDKYSCKEYMVTISQAQTGEGRHPSRNLIEKLTDKGCRIYTSTDYICMDAGDTIHRIIKQGEIVL